MIYKKTTLKNGLQIITAPMEGTQTMTAMVLAGVGSRFETEKEAGLSHFVEHMLFKGSKKYPSTLAISEKLDSVGGEFNAFTSKDKTVYYAKVDSRHSKTALDVLFDMYLNPKMKEEEIKRERGTILQELNMYEDTPLQQISDIFENLLYKRSPLGRDTIGYKKTIKAFKRKDFINYRKRFYAVNNSIVCVAGKINEKEIINKAKEYFADKKEKKVALPKKIIEKQTKPEVKIKYKKTDQTHLILGVRAYDYNHKDRFALAVLAVILGGNMSSRLFIKVRERRGLAYSVKTSVEAFSDGGYLATQAGVEHKNLEKTLEIILKEYKRISVEKVSEKELQKAKDYIKGKSIMGFESSSEVALFFIEQGAKKNQILTLEEELAFIDKVSVNDVLRVAKDIFCESKLNLVIVGPHKNARELKKLLKL